MTAKQTRSAMRTTIKRTRQALLAIFLAYLVLLAGFSEFNPSPVDLAVYPSEYSILDWEINHLPSKWTHKLAGFLPGEHNKTREEKIAQVKDFFDLGVDSRQLEQQLLLGNTASDARAGQQRSAPANAAPPTEQITDIKKQRQKQQADVEETIEVEISRTLERENLSSPLGVFPPVDVVFTSSPHLLILSPRDKIQRKQDILLNPGLSILDKESIERQITSAETDLSAYIEDTGGVAVYPSVVTDLFGLRSATEITSHEWIHQWLFFRPLGRGYWSGPEMTSLNETVASLAGQELGDQVYTSLTGEVVERTQPTTSANNGPDEFDFRSEMRQTRLQTEVYLAAGKIEEAETYMEERRQLFIANGYPIRKLNQAYFAFHGTYAASAASISPIGDQVQQLRDHSDTLEQFLKTVSDFSTYQEFLDYLNQLPKIPEKNGE